MAPSVDEGVSTITDSGSFFCPPCAQTWRVLKTLCRRRATLGLSAQRSDVGQEDVPAPSWVESRYEVEESAEQDQRSPRKPHRGRPRRAKPPPRSRQLFGGMSERWQVGGSLRPPKPRVVRRGLASLPPRIRRLRWDLPGRQDPVRFQNDYAEIAKKGLFCGVSRCEVVRFGLY